MSDSEVRSNRFVPPQGRDDVGGTEPLAVPQAAPSECPRCGRSLEWHNNYALDEWCGMLWRWAPDQEIQYA